MSKEKTGSKKYYKTSTLTPLKKKFAEEFAKTDNGTQSMLKVKPELTVGSAGTIANRMLKNVDVSREIEYQKSKLEKLASRAVDRVESLIASENETIATTNIWKTIEQVQGKATQKIETQNTSVNISIDLSSGDSN